MVRVVTAAAAAARDAAAIAAGTPSRALMRRAGEAAAHLIRTRFADRLRDGVFVVTGPGNNGGDGWVAARALAESGVRVRVREAVPSRTGDAFAAREDALPHVTLGSGPGSEQVAIDALLGTGARGAPAGPMAEAVEDLVARRERGASVVALDLPSGIDADTGAGTLAVRADLTVSFGTIKRGHLLARAACGDIVVVDIGLGEHADLDDGAPSLTCPTAPTAPSWPSPTSGCSNPSRKQPRWKFRQRSSLPARI